MGIRKDLEVQKIIGRSGFPEQLPQENTVPTESGSAGGVSCYFSR